MTGSRAVRAALGARGWPVASAPSTLLAYMFPIEAIALVWSAIAISRGAHSSLRELASLGLLIVIAIGFEEGSRRSARMQIRMSSQLRTDMTSVWAVGGAVALPSSLAVLLLGAVLVYDWFRHQRPAGEPMYRKAFVTSTALLGCLVAGAAYRGFAEVCAGMPWALAGPVPVLLAILAYTTVNRLLVTVVLVMMGVRGRGLLGSRDDNLIELATLCLGGLVSIAVLNEPWLAILVIAPMVTLQRGALVRELETAAATDAKTGLLNAVAWEQLAQRELSRAVRENYDVAVLIVDVDRFKLVNDRYGHLVGDKVLRGIGRCLGAAMRQYDTVGRFGGEEFVAVLPEADDVTAMIIAERVRARVNQLRVSDLVDGLAPTDDDLLAVSIGVSCTPTDGSDLQDLLHAADHALYGAKAAGRNRVQLAHRGGGELPERVSHS
jgi:diguanylate cyclase (GGDEF)-like protein